MKTLGSENIYNMLNPNMSRMKQMQFQKQRLQKGFEL